VAYGHSRHVLTAEVLVRTYGGRAVTFQNDSSTFICD
jgi:hypothetical protein